MYIDDIQSRDFDGCALKQYAEIAWGMRHLYHQIMFQVNYKISSANLFPFFC